MRNIVLLICITLFALVFVSCDLSKDKHIDEERLLTIINGWNNVLKDCDNYNMVSHSNKKVKNGSEKREIVTVSVFKNPAKVKVESYTINGIAYTKESPYIQIFVRENGGDYGYARFFNTRQYEWKRMINHSINGVYPIEPYLVTDNYETILNESYEKLGVNPPKFTTAELIGELDVNGRSSYRVRTIQKREDIINWIRSTYMLTDEFLSQNSTLNDTLMAISDKEIHFFINKETHYIEESMSTRSVEEEIATLMCSMLLSNKTLDHSDLYERIQKSAGVTSVKTYYFINEAEDFDIPVIEE